MTLEEILSQGFSKIDEEEIACWGSAQSKYQHELTTLPQNFFDIIMDSYNLEVFEKMINFILSGSNYSEEQIALLKELLVASYVTIPGFLSGNNYDLHARQIYTLYSLPNSLNSFIDGLVEGTDCLEHEFPLIFKYLREDINTKKFEIIKNFILSQLEIYNGYELENMLHEQHYNFNMRFIGKKRAEAFNKLISSIGNTYDSVELKCIQFLEKYSISKIIAFLDRAIVGQDEAKRAVALLLFRHVKRIVAHDSEKEIPKRNYMFIGPTGSGKTQLFIELKKISPVSILIVDSTNISSEGFSGNDKGDLIAAYDKQVDDIERCIWVFDEADKFFIPEISSSGENVNMNIQADILKLVEGGEITIKRNIFNSENITFVFTGSFKGMFHSFEKNKVCGFLSSETRDDKKNTLFSIQHKLLDYGIMPELLGRISRIIILDSLSIDSYKIITLKLLPKIIEEYKYLNEVTIEFNLDVVDTISSLAYKSECGVRDIINMLYSIIDEELFEYGIYIGENKTVTISEDVVKKNYSHF